VIAPAYLDTYGTGLQDLVLEQPLLGVGVVIVLKGSRKILAVSGLRTGISLLVLALSLIRRLIYTASSSTPVRQPSQCIHRK